MNVHTGAGRGEGGARSRWTPVDEGGGSKPQVLCGYHKWMAPFVKCCSIVVYMVVGDDMMMISNFLLMIG